LSESFSQKVIKSFLNQSFSQKDIKRNYKNNGYLFIKRSPQLDNDTFSFSLEKQEKRLDQKNSNTIIDINDDWFTWFVEFSEDVFDIIDPLDCMLLFIRYLITNSDIMFDKIIIYHVFSYLKINI
jgi:hypothetical protein